jgi:hypothetical protein
VSVEVEAHYHLGCRQVELNARLGWIVSDGLEDQVYRGAAALQTLLLCFGWLVALLERFHAQTVGLRNAIQR